MRIIVFVLIAGMLFPFTGEAKTGRGNRSVKKQKVEQPEEGEPGDESGDVAKKGKAGKNGKPIKVEPISLGGYRLDIAIPANWGAAIAIPTEENDGRLVSVPVLDASMLYSGQVFFKAVPPVSEADISALTVAMASIPEVFTDDWGTSGPLADRDPYALTAAQKVKALGMLSQVYTSKIVPEGILAGIEMAPPKDLVGGWWGTPDAILSVISIRYFQNETGSMRGVAFFFTEDQNLNFKLGYRIVLLEPGSRSVILLNCPLSGVKEIAAFRNGIATAPDRAAAEKVYHEGVAFVRNPELWKTTQMGKVIEQVETAMKKASVLSK